MVQRKNSGFFLATLIALSACVSEIPPEHIATKPLVLDDYQLQVTNNTLQVVHLSEPDHLLWASLPSGELLTAAKTRLDIRDTRSSYTIKERTSRSCELAEIHAYEHNGDELIFSGPFNDCSDLSFELKFSLVQGQLQFVASTNKAEFNHLSLHYQSNATEYFYGFGEQFSYLNLKGQNVPVLTQEQGIGRGSKLISFLVDLFSPGSAGDAFSSYYSVPQYISDQRRSLFLENSEYSRFDLRDENSITVNVFSEKMTGRILYGDTLLDLIEAFTLYSGRMKALPDWINSGAVLGLQGGTTRARNLWTSVQNAGTPVAALWLQDWVGRRLTFGGAAQQLWWNWELDESLYPNWFDLVNDLDEQGIRVMGYINPFLVDVSEKGQFTRNMYEEARDLGYLVLGEDGAPVPITITDFDAGIVDISNPQARQWLKAIIKDNLVGSGLSGWMADFGEALPFDANLANGETGLSYHNKYPVEWAKLNAEVVEELGTEDSTVFFMRSGFTQSPNYSSLFWLGDQVVNWDQYDGLKSSIIGLINGGFSGLSLNHSDIGGYTSLTFAGIGLKRTDTLLKRWMEANAFSAVYRTHEGLAPDANAQVYNNTELISHFARFAKVYAALADYRKVLMREAETKGYPVVRHPILHFPSDAYFKDMDVTAFQFMLGKDFMVAPALFRNTTSREVYLPAGTWIHLWSGEIFSSRSGTTLIAAAPVGEPPVYYKANSAMAAVVVERLKAEGVIALEPAAFESR